MIALTRSSSTRTSPISDEGPATTLSQPGGRPASSSSSARSSAESGVCARGLEHDRAARRERGGELVSDKVEREVERRDRADDPDRAAQREAELALAGLRRVHRHHLAGELARLDGREGVGGHGALGLDPGGLERLARFVRDLAGHLIVTAPRPIATLTRISARLCAGSGSRIARAAASTAFAVSAAPAFGTRPTTSPE